MSDDTPGYSEMECHDDVPDSSLPDVEDALRFAAGQNSQANERKRNGRAGSFVSIAIAVSLVFACVILLVAGNRPASSSRENEDSAISGRNLQNIHGICSGEATPCDNVYSPTMCTNVGSTTAVCDAVSTSCQATCARASLSGFESPCQCRQESCVGFNCDYQFSCVGGTPSCQEFADPVVCALTHGCRWVTGSGASLPEEPENAPLSETHFRGRAEHVKSYLIEQGISSEEDLSNTGTPQQMAMNYIITGTSGPGLGRPYIIEVPDGDLTTQSGYDFVTRYVLSVLFYALNGQRWVFFLNFLTPTPVCEWFSQLQYADLKTEHRGVVCDFNTSEVTQLLLNQNNLQGNLPTELALITSLATIDLDTNLVNGPIPDSFQDLTNLESFFSSKNRMNGTLPSWINVWKKLRNINWSSNLFSGTIPANMGNLEELTGIALDNNLLTGSFDGLFDTSNATGLKKLEQFYAENNRFTGTLGENFLKDLANLTYLDISDNRFSGQVPVHLFELPSLLVMDLHDNEFDLLPSEFPSNDHLEFLALHKSSYNSQSIPSSISNLEALRHLDLSQNGFTGMMPESLGTLTDLRYLFLAQNDFTPGDIPQWVLGLSTLAELSLKSTNRTGTIPDNLGNELQGLVLLDLDDNNLGGEIPLSLGLLRNLNVLLLNRNNFTGELPDTFSNLVDLRLLYIEANAELEGDLGALFCENPRFAINPVIIADCNLCYSSDCCTQCCENGEACNTGYHVPDLDPMWQLGYNRVFFTFQREDYFIKQNYEDGEEASTARLPPG
ncbi:serine threonine-protein kinase BRI1-like [Seminavis robusta]|uniref:Serine threonine-protein kinase BRI1-like n=1 Tax=Seminavis robusta TaxID=568900 RepID=A0A9N8DQE8_9STRA|nr:serine threonine-protein kinase BRI1-like [Seminavis robusta]|eukprot:Sro213_g088580.1 serine threonine-protein kinase BRI1-like (783) ;mRNA; f:76308-78939